MPQKIMVKFLGTNGSVELTDCPDVFAYFPTLFQNWPYEISHVDDPEQEPIFSIEKIGNDYRISSSLNRKAQSLKHPLNTACSLISELAWARLHMQPDLLCFHGAAVEFNGQLVLFPNRYRAGKSTLVACLSALGRKVFTDDYLPMEFDEVDGFFGISNGAAPRLRLPIPTEFSTDLKAYLKDHEGPKNKQYLYLSLNEGLLAHHGERLPISTVVLLDRVDNACPEILDAQPADVLRRLIKQNFSRSINPARILELLGFLVSSTRLKILRYSNAEEAGKLLNRKFGGMLDERIYPKFKLCSPDRLYENTKVLSNDECIMSPNQQYVQAENIVELFYDEDCFIASSSGAKIHHLDRIAKAIWAMLKAPITLAEIIDVFQTAFPDQPSETIKTDILKAVSDFARHGLLDVFENPNLSNRR